jgi:tetratricopeptide (TPR) repeat protein
MPPNSQRLTELVESGADLSRNVVWLNEIQNFLGPGQLRAETIRRLLIDKKHPVVLIGTIWTTTYDRLCGQSSDEEGQQIDADAKEILQLARRFNLKGFSLSEHQRARELASTDPRLEEAVTHEHGEAHLTEILAAVPDLIDRWEQAANPYGAAVISSCVDARLCGYPEPIPEELLSLLAAAHLSGSQRAQASDEWLADALQWACHPVRGSVAPLTADASEIGGLDGYRVSDILVQHAQRNADRFPIQESRWPILISNATPHICQSIGSAAYELGRFSHAEQAWKIAFDGGETDVAAILGFLFFQTGKLQEAHTWWERAIEVDGAAIASVVGNYFHHAHQKDEARYWWRRAVEIGGAYTAITIGDDLWRSHELDEANIWWGEAVDIGGNSVTFTIGLNLFDQGATDEARSWWNRFVETQNTPAVSALARTLFEQGAEEEARFWWDRAAEMGDEAIMAIIGYYLHDHQLVDEARTFWERAVEASGASTALSIGLHLFDQDATEEARLWFTRSIDVGGAAVARTLVNALSERGAAEEARAWRSSTDNTDG